MLLLHQKSSNNSFQQKEYREACAFLLSFLVLKECIKTLSRGVFLLKWSGVFITGEKTSNPWKHTGTTHPQSSRFRDARLQLQSASSPPPARKFNKTGGFSLKKPETFFTYPKTFF